MPNALIFIVGADSKPFAQEMRRMEAIARASSVSMASQMARGAHMGFSGLFRESITIPREIIEGRGIGRILGSFTLLLQYMGALVSKSKEAGGAALAQAEAFDLLAMREANAGKKAIEAAQAMAWANELGSASERAKAADLQREAAATIEVAAAYRAKAEALRESAAMEAVEAAASKSKVPWYMMAVTPFWTVVGVLAAIAAAAGFAYYQFKKMMDALSDPVWEAQTQRINNQNYGISRTAQLWREVAVAIQDVIDKYDSASERARRLAEVTSESARNQQRLDELAKQTELARAKTPAERYAIEKRYSDLSIKRLHDENNAAIQARANELRALHDEATRKALERTQVLHGTASDETWNTNIGNTEKAVAANKKWLEEHAEPSKVSSQVRASIGPGWRQEMENDPRLQSDEYKHWLQIQQQTVQMQANLPTMRAQATADHDKNERAKKLQQEIVEDEKKAAELRVSGHVEEAKAYAREVALKREELARLGLIRAQEDSRGGRGVGIHEELNSLQRIGGMRTVNSMATLEQTQRRSERHLAHISQTLDRQQRDSHSRGFGRVQH